MSLAPFALLCEPDLLSRLACLDCSSSFPRYFSTLRSLRSLHPLPTHHARFHSCFSGPFTHLHTRLFSLGAPPHRLATRIPPHHSPGTPWPALHPSALALHLAFGFGPAPPLTWLPLKPLCTSLGPGPFSRRLTRLPPTLPHSGPAFCHFGCLLHRQQPRTYGSASLSACLTYTALAPSHSIATAAQRTPPTGPALGAAPVSDGLVFAPQSRPLRPG